MLGGGPPCHQACREVSCATSRKPPWAGWCRMESPDSLSKLDLFRSVRWNGSALYHSFGKGIRQGVRIHRHLDRLQAYNKANP